MKSQLIGNFVSYLRQFVPITDDEVKTIVLPSVSIKKFQKKDIITKAGDIENYINFIDKGVVIKYYKMVAENKVIQIAIEGNLISCEESFYTRTPSEFFTEAVEPTVLISMSYDDLEKIFAANHSFERLGRLVTLHTMVLKGKWQMSFIRQTPRERFLKFVEDHPEILQRVPQKYLASYLNIKPETFSRFKHLVRKDSKAMK